MLGPLAQAGKLGGAEHATRVTLLTGSMGAKAASGRRCSTPQSGEAGIVIGTHALIQEHVQFADLGLVVVDEQHRFGVEQRDALARQGRPPPHVLVMTATPIPRTVAMTVFGDLEISTLRELPAGRPPIATTVVPLAERPLVRAGSGSGCARRSRRAPGLRRRARASATKLARGRRPDEPPTRRSREARRPPLAVRRRARRARGGPAGRAAAGGAARPAARRREGPRDARVRRAARSTCWSPPP